jgi:hypothetical protein
MAVILRSAALITGTSMPTTGFTSLWWLPGTTGGSTADATDALARFRAVWDGLKSHMDDGLTIDFDPICIAVEATTGVLTGAFAGTDPSSVTGTAAGDPLPSQTQGLVRLATSTVISGRRLRGRLFIPGPVEADNTSAGVPSSTYTTDVTTAAATLFDAGATASEPVIWHRPTGGSGGNHGLVTGVTTVATWSVLRSRRS